MCAVKYVGPLKIHQLDPDLQTRVKELSLTSLAEFQALARNLNEQVILQTKQKTPPTA